LSLALLFKDESDSEAGVGASCGDGLAHVSAEVLEGDVLAQVAGRVGAELNWLVFRLPGVNVISPFGFDTFWLNKLGCLFSAIFFRLDNKVTGFLRCLLYG